MQKTIDGVAFKFSVFVILLIWINYLTGSFLGATLLGGLLTLVIVLIANAVAEKRAAVKYPKKDFYNQLALLGSEYTLSLYESAVNVVGDTCIYSAFRFSAITLDDVAAAYRKCAACGKSEIIILCQSAARNVRVFANSLPYRVTVIDAPALFYLLKKSDNLPDLINLNKPKLKFNFKSTMTSAFSKANARYFTFSGVILALMVYTTPLKIYYIILSTLSLIFALICNIKNK